MTLFFMKLNFRHGVIMILKINILVNLDDESDEIIEKLVQKAPQLVDNQSTPNN